MPECDNCGYDTKLEDFAYGSRLYRFCKVCSSTYLSRATTCLHKIGQADVWLLRSIGYLGNMILDAIADRQIGG